VYQLSAIFGKVELGFVVIWPLIKWKGIV
jgi:hypothetical protein